MVDLDGRSIKNLYLRLIAPARISPKFRRRLHSRANLIHFRDGNFDCFLLGDLFLGFYIEVVERFQSLMKQISRKDCGHARLASNRFLNDIVKRSCSSIFFEVARS